MVVAAAPHGDVGEEAGELLVGAPEPRCEATMMASGFSSASSLGRSTCRSTTSTRCRCGCWRLAGLEDFLEAHHRHLAAVHLFDAVRLDARGERAGDVPVGHDHVGARILLEGLRQRLRPLVEVVIADDVDVDVLRRHDGHLGAALTGPALNNPVPTNASPEWMMSVLGFSRLISLSTAAALAASA